MNSNTQPRKILILAANPSGLRLDQEIREIEDAIQRAIRRDHFQIVTRQAVRPKDIRRSIAEERPEIVHFCGHGTEDGSLILEDDGGQRKLVKPEGLAALFELHADYVDCVLINACHSEKPAEAISQHINYVIGMNQAVNDKTAIKFAEGFYDALGYDAQDNKEEFQRAFNEGIVAIKLEGLPGASIPVIKKNKEEIIKADRELMAQVNPQKAAMSKYNTQIHGNVQGFIQGDNAQVEMTFRDKP
ncbi:MAG: CHAT domain-containing protein [Nostoc sp. DedQUE04]|uniref:CHAT domain-containing protein n=1 Tax=Nostoc sp. DedQUE04 TaxID=3075390 RepID=UPI002AD2FA2B|nr:CHAT domain-containing protein [Nostoc sp. DedQUE04]MDZ8141125.1 CHAT domain-containing protein [Nostoc sp. DedQUE04]